MGTCNAPSQTATFYKQGFPINKQDKKSSAHKMPILAPWEESTKVSQVKRHSKIHEYMISLAKIYENIWLIITKNYDLYEMPIIKSKQQPENQLP